VNYWIINFKHANVSQKYFCNFWSSTVFAAILEMLEIILYNKHVTIFLWKSSMNRDRSPKFALFFIRSLSINLLRANFEWKHFSACTIFAFYCYLCIQPIHAYDFRDTHGHERAVAEWRLNIDFSCCWCPKPTLILYFFGNYSMQLQIKYPVVNYHQNCNTLSQMSLESTVIMIMMLRVMIIEATNLSFAF